MQEQGDQWDSPCFEELVIQNPGTRRGSQKRHAAHKAVLFNLLLPESHSVPLAISGGGPGGWRMEGEQVEEGA